MAISSPKWQLSAIKSKYFQAKELACPCCGKVEMKQELIDRLDEIRELYGKPIRITSGFRCEKHNSEVGGKPNSAHVTGEAVDIACSSSEDRFVLIRLALASGFFRIGIANGFIHIDISGGLPGPRLWLY